MPAPQPARCAGMQKPEPTEAPGWVRRDPPGTRAESALGPDDRGTGAEQGSAVQSEGCELALRSRGHWGRGAGAGDGTPSGMSPCRSGAGAGGRGAGGVTHLSLTASAPAPSRASQPAPAPPKSSETSRPLGLHGVPGAATAGPAPTSSARVRGRGRSGSQRLVSTATTWALQPDSPSGAPLRLWPLYCYVPLGRPLSLSEPGLLAEAGEVTRPT